MIISKRKRGIGAYDDELEEVGLFGGEWGTHCWRERERVSSPRALEEVSESVFLWWRAAFGERGENGGVYLLQPYCEGEKQRERI